ncbi:hypothetical protein EMMF5_005925 [Cystobasidiomycetes sp. EMM_F5]
MTNIENDDDAAFQRAVAFARSSKIATSNATKLELYAYFKIVTVAVTPAIAGLSRPSLFEFEGRAKFDAWSRIGTALQSAGSGERAVQEARKQYLKIARKQLNFVDTPKDNGLAANKGVEPSTAPSRERTADEMLDDVDNVDDETGYSASGQGSNMVVVSRMRAADDDEQHADVVELLLKLGADATVKDSEGSTALDTARILENNAIVALLQ